MQIVYSFYFIKSLLITFNCI